MHSPSLNLEQPKREMKTIRKRNNRIIISFVFDFRILSGLCPLELQVGAGFNSNGADERLPPQGASVSIRFDGSRCFRARHQDRPRIRPNGTREARAIDRVTRRLLARRCRRDC
jgi:hypothetical protein